MKTPISKTAKVVTIFIGVGCLIGALVPLPDHGKACGAVATLARTRAADAGLSGGVLQVPKEVTVEWASGCASTRPDEFFRWLLKADPQPSSEVVDGFFSAWILRDPDAAFRAALRLPSRFGYDENNRFFYNKIIETFYRDPVVAIRWAGQVEWVIAGGNSVGLDDQYFEHLDRLDPDGFRSAIKDIPVGGLTNVLAAVYAAHLARKDVNEGLRWTLSLGVEFQNDMVPMVIYEMAKGDPAATREYMKNAPSNIKQYAANNALGRGSTSDILEGMKWLEEEMGISSYTGLSNLLAGLYLQDPKAAEDYVKSIGEGAQRVHAAEGFGDAATNSKDTEAVSMMVGLPNDLRIPAAHAAMMRRLPGWYPAFLNPLNDGSISPPNMDAYIHELATFLDGDKGVYTVAEIPENLARFQDWIRDHPGPNRDRFILEAYEVVKDKPDLLKKAFENVPSDELKRILETKR